MAFFGDIAVGVAAAELAIPRGSAVLLKRPAAATGTVYVGFDSTVTTLTGTPVEPGEAIGLSGRISGAGPGSGIWLIADAAGSNVRYLLGTY